MDWYFALLHLPKGLLRRIFYGSLKLKPFNQSCVTTFQIRKILKIEMPENLLNGQKVYLINKPISLISFNYITLKLI